MNRTNLPVVLALLAGLWGGLHPGAARAHGDEPHGDEPHPVAATAAPAGRLEAATDAFELVGQLQGGALVLYLNRYATSEPVAGATVELESGPLRAVAAYQDAHGSYVVTEPRFVQALSQPGEHPLLATVTAGPEADLMEATLSQPVEQAPTASRPAIGAAAVAVALLIAAVGGALAWRVRRGPTVRGVRP
ncbi:MAG: hypothetical protein HY856_05090 [Burkholderiales bacterium]|nr:hypothetical protein [Burkholderiales bacterium]